MAWVVDASVAAKWFVAEEGHGEALDLLDAADDLMAPDVIVTVAGTIAWKQAQAGRIGPEHAALMAAAVPAYLPNMVASAGLVERAVEIALELDLAVSDCLYLACAERHDAIVVTANARLVKAVRDTAYEALTCYLSGWKALAGA